jgi:hypothetical protein
MTDYINVYELEMSELEGPELLSSHLIYAVRCSAVAKSSLPGGLVGGNVLPESGSIECKPRDCFSLWSYRVTSLHRGPHSEPHSPLIGSSRWNSKCKSLPHKSGFLYYRLVGAMCPLLSGLPQQWYSTGGTRRHLRGYVDYTICITCVMYQQLWG